MKQVRNPGDKKGPLIRPPIFSTGDCLSIKLSARRYGAALVLATDHRDINYGKYGRNLICTLDYLNNKPPSIRVGNVPVVVEN
jgi:hypothetical protein